MKRSFLVLFFAAMAAMPQAQSDASGYAAHGYSPGYVSAEGYTWRDGYWWWGIYPFTRTWVSPYWSGGYYHAGYWRYDSVRGYVTPAAPEQPALSPKDPAYREKILDYFITQAKYEGRIKEEAARHNAFMEAIAITGMKAAPYTGPVRMPYGASSHGNLQYGSHGANGDTIYGYSFNTVADLYNTLDLNSLYQQVERSTSHAQETGLKAFQIQSQLVSQAVDGHAKAQAGREREREIMAKAAALKALAQVLAAPTAKIEQKQEYLFKVTPDGKAQMLSSLPQQQSMNEFMNNVARPDCAKCHSGPQEKRPMKNGFNIEEYPSFNAAQKKIVHERLLTGDASQLMPRDDGGKGYHLPADKLKQWLTH